MDISTERPWTGNRWASFFAEFLRAAVRPSFAAALGAVVVAAVLIVASCLLITEQRVSLINPGYLMIRPNDEYARLTIDVLRVAHTPPEPLSVTIVGDSSLREAITSEEDLRQRIKLKTGQDAAVRLLVAGGLTHWEIAAIIDRLSKRSQGIIVAEISPYHLSRTVGRLKSLPRLGFNSPAFDRELRIAKYKPPVDTHSYFLNEAGFFLLRPAALYNLRRGPFPNSPGPHIRETAKWDPKFWRVRHKQIYHWVRDYRLGHRKNLAVYQRMTQRVGQIPGLQLVLVNSVMNPEVESPMHSPPKGFAVTMRRYSTDVTNFAAQNKLPYWDITSEAHLSAGDFFDYTHVRRQNARERFTDVLAGRIAKLVVNPEQSS